MSDSDDDQQQSRIEQFERVSSRTVPRIRSIIKLNRLSLKSDKSVKTIRQLVTNNTNPSTMSSRIAIRQKLTVATSGVGVGGRPLASAVSCFDLSATQSHHQHVHHRMHSPQRQMANQHHNQPANHVQFAGVHSPPLTTRAVSSGCLLKRQLSRTGLEAATSMSYLGGGGGSSGYGRPPPTPKVSLTINSVCVYNRT